MSEQKTITPLMNPNLCNWSITEDNLIKFMVLKGMTQEEAKALIEKHHPNENEIE